MTDLGQSDVNSSSRIYRASFSFVLSSIILYNLKGLIHEMIHNLQEGSLTTSHKRRLQSKTRERKSHL